MHEGNNSPIWESVGRNLYEVRMRELRTAYGAGTADWNLLTEDQKEKWRVYGRVAVGTFLAEAKADMLERAASIARAAEKYEAWAKEN